MPCFHPLRGYKSRSVNYATGKRSVTFNAREGFIDLPVSVACGRCVGCRLERSRQWALRCVHEAQLHPDNSFITLTYNDDFLPEGGTLIKKHFQDFMKRLRKRYSDRKIQYFHCGEYGEACKKCRLPRKRCTCSTFVPGIGRPHYHALLFGLAWPDQQLYRQTGDIRLFTSDALSKLWPWGFSTVGALTFESAAYCARYVMKKMTGDVADDHYWIPDLRTGELHQVLPEYITMSLKPAIAKGWFKEFHEDVYPDDFVVMRGMKMKPPRYYDGLLKELDLAAHTATKEARAAYAAQHKSDSTPERLAVRETCTRARLLNLKRNVE